MGLICKSDDAILIAENFPSLISISFKAKPPIYNKYLEYRKKGIILDLRSL